MKPTQLLTPTGLAVMADEAAQRCEFRSMEEAKQAVEILECLKTLGRQNSKTK